MGRVMARVKQVASKKTQRLPQVILLSGGSGGTVQRVMTAALAQFPGSDIEIVRKVNVRTKKEALAVVREAATGGAIICHSLVDPQVRQAFDAEVRSRNVACVDTLGPLISMLGDYLEISPQGRAGLLYELHREQFDRMDAVDFTMAHDDGSRLVSLHEADVVIVGVSRVSKSVTCFYLASRGIRAANVPLIPGLPVQPELKRISRRRVIGLTMNASHLASVRRARLERISHRPIADYGDVRGIQRELRAARDIMRERKWECIDVSYRATEEVAGQIIEMIPRR